MGDRERILARIRKGLGRDVEKYPVQGTPSRPFARQAAPDDPSREVLMQRFSEACLRECVEVHTACDMAEAGERLVGILNRCRAKRIFSWLDPLLEHPEIELSLVRGVHGPGTVHVIVIQDAAAAQPS